MELTLSLFFITLILLFVFLKLIRKTSDKYRNEPSPNLPPGPWKLPIIGSIHQLFLAASVPHRALAKLSSKYGPVMHLQLGELSTVVISGARVAKELLTTHDIACANRQTNLALEVMTYNCLDVGFAPYGDYWRQMRKICVLELLSKKKVREFASIREDESCNMIRSIQTSANPVVNLTETVVAFSNAITCRVTIGSRSKYQNELVRLTSRMTEISGGLNVYDFFPSTKILPVITGATFRIKKLFKAADRIVDEIIQEHMEKLATFSGSMANNPSQCSSSSNEEDIVDVLLKIDQTGGLDFSISSSSIKAIMNDFFMAGTETVSTVILWTMSELMRNPRVLETAQAELRGILKGKNRINEADLKGLTYLKLVLKESLRLHPAGPLLLSRECREKCEIEGYDIPVGTKIIVNAWAIHMDPEFWTNPETFEPERFLKNEADIIGPNFEYLPFGAGRRLCPGISFGMSIVELALAQLLYHFDWKIPGGIKPELLDVSEILGLSLKRKNNLCLAATVQYPFV